MRKLHEEKTIPYLLGLLEDDEAADWRAAIEAEMRRLTAE